MRPFIHLNCAVGDNGLWSHPASGAMKLSCPVDWRRVHLLRERYDAVAVGGRTWVMDKPRLTVRAEHLGREPIRQPARVVFAGGQACEAHGGGSLIVISSSQSAGRGTHVIRALDRALAAPLQELWDMGIGSVLVEGGPTLAKSFLTQGLVDCVTVFVCAENEQRAESAARMALPIAAEHVSIGRFGSGFLVEHRPRAACAAASGA